MSDQRDVRIEMITPDAIFGNSEYNIQIRITNLSNSPIINADIRVDLPAGKQIPIIARKDDVENDEVEAMKKRIIKEMEEQVETSFRRQKIRNLSVFEKVLYAYAEMVGVYVSLFSSKNSFSLTPTWACEALKIGSIEDVERLKKEIIEKEPADSTLRRMFRINNEKLLRLIERTEGGGSKTIATGADIQPGETYSFPFRFRAPVAFKTKKYQVQFAATYTRASDSKHISRSIDGKIPISASEFVAPSSCMIGSVAGLIIRAHLMGGNAPLFDIQSINWGTVLSTVILGVVVSFLTAKKPESSKAITVEDAFGGFILGALVGMYSEHFIGKLNVLIN